MYKQIEGILNMTTKNKKKRYVQRESIFNMTTKRRII